MPSPLVYRLSFIGFAFFAGCSTTNVYEEKQKILNSWIGGSNERLVEAWGIPDREKDVSSYHYEQYDHRCLYFAPDTGEYIAAGLASMADALNAGLGHQQTRYASAAEPQIHEICDRWLFKLKADSVVKVFASDQSADSSSSTVTIPRLKTRSTGDNEKDLLIM